MIRFLKVLGLWCLFSIAGLITIAMTAWALVATGANVLITPFLVLGLASVLPVSLAVADNVVPRGYHVLGSSMVCPHCGAPFAPGVDPKPAPELWPFL